MSVTDELDDYQLRAVDWVMGRSGACVFMEQGTGKTHVTAGVIERLQLSAGLSFTALIVVPLANLETTWVAMIHRLPVKLCRSWDEFKVTRGDRVLLLNYEALTPRRENGREPSWIRRLLHHEWTAVIYDESQRLKARASKASRLAARFKSIDHRLILTGTPVEQTPQDLWAQMRFACPDVFGTRWADFDNEWLRPCGFMGYDREFIKSKLPKFLKRIQPHILRVTKAQVLNLPPLRYVRSTVQLLGQQAKIYREIDDDGSTVLVNGQVILCDMRITQLVRLQQVVGGFIRTDTGESVIVGNAKRRRLTRLLRDIDAPVVIFCKYREEMDICTLAAIDAYDKTQLVRRCAGPECEVDGCRDPYHRGYPTPRIGYIRGVKGKAGKRRRVETIEAFQRGEIDVLICQVRAGGVGLNLFASCEVIVYSATFSYIDFDQMISRVHRRGQTRACRVTLLQIENSVDVEIYEALLMKRDVSEQVLDHPRRTRKRI